MGKIRRAERGLRDISNAWNYLICKNKIQAPPSPTAAGSAIPCAPRVSKPECVAVQLYMCLAQNEGET
jgi:hypothetical protein